MTGRYKNCRTRGSIEKATKLTGEQEQKIQVDSFEGSHGDPKIDAKEKETVDGIPKAGRIRLADRRNAG